MFKSFFLGFLKKAGESLWVWLWPATLTAGAALWVWLWAPDQLQFSHRQLVLSGLLVITFLLFAYAAGFYIARGRFERKPPVVDHLQQEILCLLWAQSHNVVRFNNMQKLTQQHPSTLRLAGERLQTNGLISFNRISDDTLMQLLPEGREYVVSAGLADKAEPTLLERLSRLDD